MNVRQRHQRASIMLYIPLRPYSDLATDRDDVPDTVMPIGGSRRVDRHARNRLPPSDAHTIAVWLRICDDGILVQSARAGAGAPSRRGGRG